MVVRYCLAACWSPFITITPHSVGNLIFTCNVDGTALIEWIHGLPRMAVY